MSVIYAWSATGDTNLQYHSTQNRGVISINFFTGESAVK